MGQYLPAGLKRKLKPGVILFSPAVLVLLTYRYPLKAHLLRAIGQQGAKPQSGYICVLEPT